MLITNYEEVFGVICKLDKTYCKINLNSTFPIGTELYPNELKVKIPNNDDLSYLQKCELSSELIRNCKCDEICETTIRTNNYPCNFENNLILCDKTIKNITVPNYCNSNRLFNNLLIVIISIVAIILIIITCFIITVIIFVAFIIIIKFMKKNKLTT